MYSCNNSKVEINTFDNSVCLEFANQIAGLSTLKLGAGDAMPFLKDFKK